MSAASYIGAAVQFEPRQFDKEGNIASLLGLAEAAARQGAELIVTPEMGTTGYCWFDRKEIAPFVETIPGPTTERFHAFAQARDVHIVIGMPEVEPRTGLYYNAAVLIGPDGVIGVHRKTHPYISEPKWAAPGNAGHQVFATKLGRIALLICMDLHFVETPRLASLQGAEVICHISNWLAERTPAPYWISRAFENGCYLIESNRWGLERGVQFSGGSCIIAPDGTLAAVIDDGDGVVSAKIDPARVREHRSRDVPARRPELYKALASNTFSWNPREFFRLYGHRPLPPGRRSRIAVAQTRPGAATETGLPRIAELTEAARRDDAELVVFPELSLAGPAAAETVPGPAVEELMSLAARTGCHIVAGLAETEDSIRYNTAVMVGPQALLGRYRKTHLCENDRSWATPGEDWTIIDTSFGRVGMLIGSDALLPEPARVLALQGCDIIACPAALPGRFTLAHVGTRIGQNYPIPTGADAHHWHHFRCRAGENNLFFAFANCLDATQGMLGKSGIFGPDTFEFPRREAMIADAEGVAVTVADTTDGETGYPTNVVRRKDLVLMRLPHHYQPLVTPDPGIHPV